MKLLQPIIGTLEKIEPEMYLLEYNQYTMLNSQYCIKIYISMPLPCCTLNQ